MKYMGSKARHASEILQVILNYLEDGTTVTWVEPFVGGANMIDKVPSFVNRYGNDLNESVILMFQGLQDGSYTPPDFVSEEEYRIMKTADNCAHKGFVGIACSYGGRWFEGYARGNTAKGVRRNYCLESKKNLLAQDIKGIVFTSGDYREMHIPPNSVIYCDPPYANTKKYLETFDHTSFWEWCRSQGTLGHKVFVSGYEAPIGWECVWSKTVNSSLTADTGAKRSVECLFRLPN